MYLLEFDLSSRSVLWSVKTCNDLPFKDLGLAWNKIEIQDLPGNILPSNKNEKLYYIGQEREIENTLL